ncbi:DsrE family protein [Halomarina ordinaria]|uniref:DsrE family protein n=1 Tax=Halomarina ordinaria TaxID=3033939 RepID=A0ABD5UB69_9EURY|nr:DsrE family protein [Halomarina sp. PSRA2]
MNVVLHCSSGSEADQRHALANARNLLADDTLDLESVAFVANGDAVWLLVDGSTHADEVADLAADVAFQACRNSLRTREIPTDDLLSGVDPASSGVGTVSKLQDTGYHYVKVP